MNVFDKQILQNQMEKTVAACCKMEIIVGKKSLVHH